ncbi:hypothetical protein B1812_00505 [Methylocystis bryophila]|uniref:Uncharacterized protein n=1 Tax=Methylocystis bryophila TaxID=655015 RepID=A0A1W6MQC2_9HYPH|nr:hypothetical protein B1812_00505 [Methylocystis bryophila]
MKANRALASALAAMTFGAWLGALAPVGASPVIVRGPGDLISGKTTIYLDAANGGSAYFSRAHSGAVSGDNGGRGLVHGFKLAAASEPRLAEGLLSFAVFSVILILARFRGLLV